jgi:hypothetical protein
MRFYIVESEQYHEDECVDRRFQIFTSETTQRKEFNRLRAEGYTARLIDPVDFDLNSKGVQAAFKWAEEARFHEN